ncbi:hypothetical protein [Lachnoclostridium phytofermentans]|uniref:hypothetical protein n=1 Tax=Lachnoclostridium phytofermentans TaxID=66219 RepID=UPI0000D80111|nr:hypothetical protein [Lachnoclostridium phytofermentans]
MSKFVKGIIAMIFFYIFNMFMTIIGQVIFFGDSFTLSYHLFTYTGLMTLCGVIVVCTCIIIEKLNEIKNLYNRVDIENNTKINE